MACYLLVFLNLSLVMGWATWGDARTAEPWDGCIPPRTAAERDEWVAHAEASGELLCDPSIVEMEFPETAASEGGSSGCGRKS